MKLWFRVMLALLMLAPFMARADGPDDQYVEIYNLIQQGDALNENGQSAAAMAKYSLAQSDLTKFQNSYPDWNVKIVAYRLRYLAAKIALISSAPATSVATAPTNTPPTPPTSPTSPAPTAPAVAAPVAAVVNPSTNPPPAAVTVAAPSNNLEGVVASLQDQLRRDEDDRATLQAKLREALSAHPVMTDPEQFNQAQVQIRDLQKENDLLKVSLDQSRGAHGAAEKMAATQVRAELADARRQMDALTRSNAALLTENGRLQTMLKANASPDAATEALRQENAVLKKQVAELQKPAPPGEDLARKLQEAQAQVAVLQSDKEILRLERTALENQVKLMPPAPVVRPSGAPVDNESTAKIQRLEAERDALEQRLDAAMKEIASGKAGSGAPAQADEAGRQLEALRARIDILEAHPVPYTAEELALLSTSQGTSLVTALHRSARSPNKELPSEALPLLTEAKRDVANQDFAGAEANYHEVLKYDARNTTVLTYLSSVQVDLNKLGEAETNIAAALAIEPNSYFSLFVLGRIRLAQSRFDDAVDVLTHAAQINPDDADIQNNLGIALSEKGLRGPAEAALRRAVQIDPGCADAHANLAFVYITQQPPLVELARWHYEKALAAGHAHNAGIEKLLDQNKTPAAHDAPGNQ